MSIMTKSTFQDLVLLKTTPEIEVGELLVVDDKVSWKRDESSGCQGERCKVGQPGQHLPQLLLLQQVALQLQVGEGREERGKGCGKAMYQLVPLKAKGCKVRGGAEGALLDDREFVVAELEMFQPSKVQSSWQGG